MSKDLHESIRNFYNGQTQEIILEPSAEFACANNSRICQIIRKLVDNNAICRQNFLHSEKSDQTVFSTYFWTNKRRGGKPIFARVTYIVSNTTQLDPKMELHRIRLCHIIKTFLFLFYCYE